MNLNINDHLVLVAGSSRGIGKAIANAFLAEQCRVVLTGRDAISLNNTFSEFATLYGNDRVMACRGDLQQKEVIDKILDKIHKRWGNLDHLIANIGSGRGKTGWVLEDADWENMFNVNLWSSLKLIQATLPDMISKGYGSVVTIASIVGIESTPAPYPYSAAKAAIINYSKNLSRSIGKYNVRVNCVAPGNILFPGGSWEKHLAKREQEIKQFIRTDVPLQRFGRPEEIADLVVFLASDRASFITGACIVADGGQIRTI